MNDELFIINRPKSTISEDIRTIRTNLKYICKNERSSVILITSAIPKEGKSFISSNLALTFANIEEKTLLIDADLRLGRIHDIFKISNEKGFSDLLISDEINEACNYIQETNIPNLDIIVRGNIPPNPSELLNSDFLDKFLNVMRYRYQHIILDGVPINGLPDSLTIASFVDEVILVTSLGYTSIDELNVAKRSLQHIDAKIAGVIVNRVPVTSVGKYSHYYE